MAPAPANSGKPPRVAGCLAQNLFWLGPHRVEPGADAYAETINVLVDLVAGSITRIYGAPGHRNPKPREIERGDLFTRVGSGMQR